MLKELKKLKIYLRYFHCLQPYKFDAMKAEIQLQQRRDDYIAARLREYDMKEVLEVKEKNWSQSPAYQILRRALLSSSLQAPWNHCNQEWSEILKALYKDDMSQPCYLENVCLLVVRALKFLFQLLYAGFCQYWILYWA